MFSDEFKRYFKFPLIFRRDFIYILSNNGQPLLTWLINPNEITEEEQIEIVNKINGYSNKKYEEKWSLKDNVFIYYGDKKMFLVRGCNLLMSDKTHNIPHEKAVKLQANFANYLINNLNK